MLIDSSPIAAIATGSARGGIGVIRLSGPGLATIVEQVCGVAPETLVPRQATYLPFVNADGSLIDKGLALFFRAPHSYTGEDVLELQGHGGPVVMQMLLRRCVEAGVPIGLRLAEPGEFTRRAFLNDKLDLAQAEAVADLIDASTEAAARSASESLSGAFSQVIHQLVEQITQLRMLVEATLDFPEEEIEFLEKSNARGQLAALRTTLEQVFTQSAQGALLRDGLKVVLAGQPNVGKSSLMNVLAGSDVAIVTPIAGTTRDKISETIQLEGIPLTIIDTAGIRDPDQASDEVERIGIERTWLAIQDADVILHLLDASHGPSLADEHILERMPANAPVIRIWNKIDQSGHRAAVDRAQDATHIYLSVTERKGLDLLRTELLDIAGWKQTGESTYLARERHLIALNAARDHLVMAEQYAGADYASDSALDLFAEELRIAQERLASITGEFSSDDLLGVIFSRFCIGK